MNLLEAIKNARGRSIYLKDSGLKIRVRLDPIGDYLEYYDGTEWILFTNFTLQELQSEDWLYAKSVLHDIDDEVIEGLKEWIDDRR
ncbi:MAG: hypothetical protein RLZZ74_3456 [Cyanobacteriota bacterium]|jgi:hypothetical protein